MLIHYTLRSTVITTLLGGLFLFALAGCNTVSETAEPGLQLVTKNASPETAALYRNLANLGKQKLLFGHQNTTAYGVLWYGDENRSDIKDITGAYPAVFGWDIGHLERGDSKNLDGLAFDAIREHIQQAYTRGAITAISWHMRDPVTGGSSWDKAESVAQIIPGGAHHQALKAALDSFVAFNESLRVAGPDGKLHYIPLIFRPWHEHNGDWFWWGKGFASEQDYIKLWRFTVNYLRDEKGLRNLIYAFSPDRSRMDINDAMSSYFYAYPGDDFVDIIGLDNYWDLGHPANTTGLHERRAYFVKSLETIAKIARERNKIAALTEGGLETVNQEKFWTDMILDSVLSNDDTREVAYLLVWRNANKALENRDHYYAPYKGHASEADFLEFFENPYTVFENNLPEMYQ